MDKNVIFQRALQKIVNYQDRNPLEFDNKFKLTVSNEELELKFLDYPSYSTKIYVTVDPGSVNVNLCCGDDRNYIICLRIILKRNDKWYIDDFAFYKWSHIKNKDAIFSMLKTLTMVFNIFPLELLCYIKHHVSKCCCND